MPWRMLCRGVERGDGKSRLGRLVGTASNRREDVDAGLVCIEFGLDDTGFAGWAQMGRCLLFARLLLFLRRRRRAGQRSAAEQSRAEQHRAAQRQIQSQSQTHDGLGGGCCFARLLEGGEGQAGAKDEWPVLLLVDGRCVCVCVCVCMDGWGRSVLDWKTKRKCSLGRGRR
ncbi:hypothetical protein LZ31DRAFT_188065 [Colletotrichum somersetense]|nr:hypothetical protein LZ31DRAFT_188065 [Colletotrichum somersetense]